MRNLKNKNENLERMENMGEFILRCIITGLNAKKWSILKDELNYKTDREELKKVIKNMEALIKEERDNVESTIPFVQKDSRLGWEPSMEYMTDEEHLRWKIRQLDFVTTFELQETWMSYDSTPQKYRPENYSSIEQYNKALKEMER